MYVITKKNMENEVIFKIESSLFSQINNDETLGTIQLAPY